MESSASAGRVASAVLDPRRWWALALVLLVYALVEVPGADGGDVGTTLPLAGSAVLVAVALIESRHPAPLVPLRTFRSRTPGRRGRPDDPDRHRRGRHAVRPHVLRPAGARLLGPQVRHQLGRARARGHGRPGAHGRGVARAHAGLLGWQLLPGRLRRAAPLPSRGRPGLRDRYGRGVAEHEAGLASGLSTTALQIGQRSAPPLSRPLPSPAPSTTWQRTKARTRSPR
jgi:hypothetical protein